MTSEKHENNLNTTALHEPEPISRIRNLLQRTLRIFISDGRVFIGTFVCTDKERNIILTNTEEFRLGEIQQGRYVGMIMVPWKYIIRTEVETTDDDGDRYT